MAFVKLTNILAKSGPSNYIYIYLRNSPNLLDFVVEVTGIEKLLNQQLIFAAINVAVVVKIGKVVEVVAVFVVVVVAAISVVAIVVVMMWQLWLCCMMLMLMLTLTIMLWLFSLLILI
jgi:hypothetical protein